MAKHKYTVLDEGAGRNLPSMPEGAQAAEGDELELDLSADQRKAMVAAGWISEPLDEEDSSKAKSKGGKG